MKTVDFIREHNACHDVAKWALSISYDMADVWDALIEQNRYVWLLWTVTRPGVFPDSTLRKLACRFVRETPLADGRTVWDLLEDERSRNAIEVAELYADGNTTDGDLADARNAACAAFYAARAASWAANAVYYAATAAADAARAAHAAARATAWAARAASWAAARIAAYTAACDAYRAASAAQACMIAELGNPFKKGSDK